MKKCSDETDELQIFLLYLTKLLVFPCRNVPYTSNQSDHILEVKVCDNNENSKNIQLYIIFTWHISDWPNFRLRHIVH